MTINNDRLFRIAQVQKRRHLGVSRRTKTNTAKEIKINRIVETKRPSGQIFITGGIGDVFAVESFLTDQDRETISEIVYATQKHESIHELFDSLKSFPNLTMHTVAWRNFRDFWCFYSLRDFLSKSKDKHSFEHAKDLSILTVFEKAKKGELRYNGSSFIKDKLTSIDHFKLPDNYIVISPYSTDKRLKERDFSKLDWNECFKCLQSMNLQGVVINSGNDVVPKNELLINLANSTNSPEAVEILKNAEGYIGIDSWLSVLAAKLFEPPFLQIKSRNDHCYHNASYYYAPHTNFSFIVRDIHATKKLDNVKSIPSKNGTMDKVIENYKHIPFCELNWCHEKGVMYQRDMTKSVDYDKDYYEKYIKYENTDISLKLNSGRTKITEKYCKSVLDIGIGSGEFIKASKIKAYGYDINPVAIQWLKDSDLFIDPYEKMPDVCGLTFWDSLEHIPNPNALLSLVKKGQYVFISMPIFGDLLNVKKSKHYRPNEHYYYFTSHGMIQYMNDSGFKTVMIDDFETQAGREDILTFVFQST